MEDGQRGYLANAVDYNSFIQFKKLLCRATATTFSLAQVEERPKGFVTHTYHCKFGGRPDWEVSTINMI